MEKLSTNRLSQVSTGSAFDSCLRFESRDDIQAKKVDEMKTRMTQMEKSMRWWNECANNWRLKWSEVRNERNKLKDECRTLRYKLEDVEKKCTILESHIGQFTRETSSTDTCEIVAGLKTNVCHGEVSDILRNIERLRVQSKNTIEKVASAEQETLSNEQKHQNLQNIKLNSDKSTDTNELNLHSNACDCELLQSEELHELRTAHRQLKKVLQDKCEELNTAFRKADAFENEIKKLRLKTDELKKELVVAEDHADNASNTIRKLQRNNDRLQEQMNDYRIGSNFRPEESQEFNVKTVE